ncbi:MAG: DUF368 domain-containing protein [Clostridia bacterium]
MRFDKPFFYRCFAGLLMGIACVLPGVSGGVLAVSFGLYRPMLDAALGFFHSPKKHLGYLLPLCVGGFAGYLLGATGLQFAMARYEAPMLMLFIGFILGGVPDLLREADAGGFRLRYLLALAGGIALALPLLLLPEPTGTGLQALNAAQALAAGAINAVGTVVPGLSTSFVMISMGWYQAYLNAVAALDLPTLALYALGFVFVAILTMRGVKWLFDHVSGYAYYAVLGFLMVSVALVFPDVSGDGLWLNLLMLVLGLWGALRMSRMHWGGLCEKG